MSAAVVTVQPSVSQLPFCVLVAPVRAALISLWYPIVLPNQAQVFIQNCHKISGSSLVAV